MRQRYVDPRISHEIRDVLRLSWMKLESGTKHARLCNLHSGDFIPLSGSLSDRRSVLNAATAARRLARTGQGLIFARTGRLAAA